MSTNATIRMDYRQATEGFVDTLTSVHPDDWDRLALGVWTIRDLAGHTSRALLTVESYLDPAQTATTPLIPNSVAYYQAAMAQLAEPEAVAERGRQAGAALGDKPVATVSELARRVQRLVDASDDAAQVNTPVGTMTLVGYLPSRTFELAVHSVDILAATGAAIPAVLLGPLDACLRLAVDLARRSGRGTEVLLALTGRGSLPAGFTVV